MEKIYQQRIEDHRITDEPFYISQGNEIDLALAAYNNQLPILLKGPTGCGKTRFVEYMTWKLSPRREDLG